MGQFDHAGVVFTSQKIQPDLLKQAMASVRKGGRLDVVVEPPNTVAEAESIVRELYGYAPPNPLDLNFTVLFGAGNHREQWQKLYSSDNADASTDEIAQQTHAATTEQPNEAGFVGHYDTVAVGGTWDHMHWGHRLMLTMAAYTARTTLIIGVTASELLVNKKHAEALDSYDERVRQSESFVKYIRPHLDIKPYALRELYGPTILVKAIGALVVSAETRQGGKQINDKRAEMSWPALEIIEVGLIAGGADGKLSSTDLRRAELDRAQLKTPASKY